MSQQRPTGGYLRIQRDKEHVGFRDRLRGKLSGRGAGLIIKSAEGARFSYTEKPLPRLPVDQRLAQEIVPPDSTLTRVDVPPELSETTACFEAASGAGDVLGRVWVHLEPLTQE